MRDWTLGPGEPLALTLAADFRFCTPDYVNDHIWDLETSGGDPPAISLRTTYGLRARTMRLFPRFTHGGRTVSDPAVFTHPPRLRHFFPNFLSVDFSPIPGIDVVAEYWVPDSHTTAGRYTVTNRSGEPTSLLLEFCGQLIPLDGQSLALLYFQSVNIMAGRSADLVPVVFITGGSQFGPGPYPSLALDLALASGGTRTLTWTQAALKNLEQSFDLARRTAALPWETQLAKIERVNTAQTIDIQTGDPDWDAAFALSQKTAFSFFFSPSQHLPNPSFVLTRQPDQGFSPRGDGTDYPHPWGGQSQLETLTLASLLPGAPELAAGLVRNFLAVQSADGEVDWKPGMAGQRGRWLATPLLANLALQTFQKTRDLDFLREVQAGLEAFIRSWFAEAHDHDGDGFPEWEAPAQAGIEDHPTFSVWLAGGEGADISTVESPALAALLYQEAKALADIAMTLNQPENCQRWLVESERIRLLVEECWNANAVLYHLRDRDTHHSPAGKLLGTQRGAGTLKLSQSFKQPVRVLVRLDLKGETTQRSEVNICGKNGEVTQNERLGRTDFHWGAMLAVATSRMVFSSLDKIEVTGLENRDRVSVSIMDFSTEDISLFLPLWAGIPTPRRALKMVNLTLFAANRFGGEFGIPICKIIPRPARGATSRKKDSDHAHQAVHLPWNTLIGEGLLRYGFRTKAAQLTSRLMLAVIKNLKEQHAFARTYNVERGTGMGERNPIQGLAPLGLFLGTLGVSIESPKRVVLSGKNPFPWPVTVKYRGLSITRTADQTEVVFPNGQSITLDDPTDAMVSEDQIP